MNNEQIREYCISKKGVTESFPFDDTALVFKVMDKMFALLNISEDSKGISLKCDPEMAIELREQYPEVTPGYHFNKKHWNTINLRGNLTDDKIKNWIDLSYDLVCAGLTKKQKEELKNAPE